MTNSPKDIEAHIDIVDLVSKYTKLKKAGANFKAVCPFPGHTEKTPSFVVSPSKQLAYCFGCHKGGGPLKFLMDLENLEFRESLEILGNMTGMAVKKYDEKTEKLIKNSYSVFKDSCNYYREALNRYPRVLDYCKERGFTDDDIKTFNIGFSDSGVEHYSCLKEKGYNDDIIVNSNIFLDIKSKKDKFINRLIFPIQNQRGDIVAFAGRVLDKSLPKYLNSPASKIYDKSSILYGFFQARNEITKKDFVLVTEGYMDVIALHRAGYKNTVCVSGTALTEKHIMLLKRLTKKIYLCFDSDKAGLNATELSLETLKNKGLEIKIINVSGGKDPDEFLKSGGDFNNEIKNARSPIGFLIDMTKDKYDLNSIDDKRKFLGILLEALKSYSDNVEKDFYLKEISTKLDIDKDVVYLEYSKLRTKRGVVETNVSRKEYSASELAIGFCLVDSSYVNIFDENLVFKDDINPDLKEALKGSEFLNSLDIDLRDRYNAISLKIDDMIMEKTSEAIALEIKKIAKAINLDIYKSKRKEYMESNDHEKLVELINMAKKYGLK